MDNTQFIMSKPEMDQLLLRAKRDESVIETELEIPHGACREKNSCALMSRHRET